MPISNNVIVVSVDPPVKTKRLATTLLERTAITVLSLNYTVLLQKKENIKLMVKLVNS